MISGAFSFAAPIGLLGLLTLPLIVALHLLQERRRRQVVSNLGLWAFLPVQVRGNRFRRVPLTWLLLIDLLIASLFSLALARPQIQPPASQVSQRQVVILLDVSTSMAGRDASPSRLGRAVGEASALLNGLGPNDRAAVLTFDAQPHWVGDTRQASLTGLIQSLESLQAGGTGSQGLAAALSLGRTALDQDLPAEFNIWTDAAATLSGLDSFPYPLVWHPVGGKAENQAVVAIEASVELNQYNVFARLANFGEKPASRLVSLLADGKVVDSAMVNIPAGATLPQVWRGLSGRPAVITVMLASQDILSEDDSASTGLSSGQQLKVVLVSSIPRGQLDPVRQALTALPNINLQVVLPAEYTPQAYVDLTVFSGDLPAFWPPGTVLLVAPQRPADGASALVPLVDPRATLAIAADAPLRMLASPLLDGLDFSGVLWGDAYKYPNLPEGSSVLLQAGDAPLLLSAQAGATHLYTLLADLDQGNFTRHPAFPILLGNLVNSLRLAPLPARIQVGASIPLPAGTGLKIDGVTPPNGKPVTFGLDIPTSWTQTSRPGAYRFDLEDQAGQKTVYYVGVNAGDASESDLLAGPAQLSSASQPTTAHTEQVPPPVELAPYILGLALAFLLVEARLAWR